MVKKSAQETYENLDSLFKRLEKYYKDEKPNPEIEKLSSELQTKIKNLKREYLLERWLTIFAVVALIVGVVILFWSELEIHFTYLIRLIIFYLTPIYDLTAFNNLQCIFKNPNFVPESRFNPKFCENICQASNEQKFFTKFVNKIDFNQTIFKEYVIESDIPIIETTETGLWKIKDNDDIINSYYNQLKDLEASEFCLFEHENNLRPKRKYNSPIDVFRQYHSNKPYSYFAHWENCGKKSSKITKRLIKRPTFFTNTVELTPHSWLFISKNFKQKGFLPLPVQNRINLFSQIKGESEIVLTPHVDCENECKAQHLIVKEGETAIITDVWQIDYKITDKTENAMLILTAQV